MGELPELTEARKVIYTPLSWGDFCIAKNLTHLDCRQGLLSVKPLFGILIPDDDEFELIRKKALMETEYARFVPDYSGNAPAYSPISASMKRVQFPEKEIKEMVGLQKEYLSMMRNDPEAVSLDLRVQAMKMGANYVVNLQIVSSEWDNPLKREYLGLPARYLL